MLYALVSDVKGYTMVSYPLVLSPSSGGLVNSLGNVVDPYIDSWQEVTTGVQFANRTTKIYIPSHYDTTKSLTYIIGLSKARSPDTRSGLTSKVVVKSDSGGSYFEIHGDVSKSHIYIGYTFGMELVLPRYMYSNGDLGYDFTGHTTTARMQFYTGLGGAIYFNIKDNSRKDWTDISGIRVANTYDANTSPFRDYFIYKVPIYQRPDNYTMKVLSDNPFPVSLVAMQWEGQYSAGFYRRS